MSRFGTGMAARVLRRLGLEPWPDSGNSPALVDELNRMRTENDELRRIATTERSEYDECEAELMAELMTEVKLVAEVERLRAERRWVPVGERLPDDERLPADDSPVLVLCHIDGHEPWVEVRASCDLPSYATHWQPLPPLPEGAE